MVDFHQVDFYQIQHFKRIREGLALGGQPTQQQLDQLIAEGVEVVLQLHVDEAPYSINSERYQLSQLGIVHLSMSVVLHQPTQSDLWHFFDFMDVYQGKNMFVHCADGFCASSMVALYLIAREGYTLDEARRMVLPGWQPSMAWLQLLDEMVPHSLS